MIFGAFVLVMLCLLIGFKWMQDALRTSFESLLVPAFEQIDGAFQKGMSEHSIAIQQQVEAAHTPLALTLKVS